MGVVLSSAMPTTSGVAAESWSQLKIGAGGFITGIDIATDGTRVCRNDTYGAYLWSSVTSTWQQLVTSTSIPTLDLSGGDYAEGVYEIRIAPSDTTIFYMMYIGRVYRSTNRGTTWTQTAFTPLANGGGSVTDPNDTTQTTYPKLHGPKLAIDPQNANHVLVGTGTGSLYRTIDGGATWSTITITAPTDMRGYCIAFDPNSSVVSTIKQGVYVHSHGNGLFASTNGGASFSSVAGSPTTCNHMVVDSSGRVFIAPDDGSMNVKRYISAAWDSKSIGTASGRNIQAIALDPGTAGRIVAVCSGGDLSVSLDNGATWAGCTASPNTSTRSSATIGWMAAASTNETFMSTGDAVFDPSQSNKLFLAEGIGVWKTSPNDTSTTAVTYIAETIGIEQLVATAVIIPSGRRPVVAAWDRPLFYVSDYAAYPSTHGPAIGGTNENIQICWDIDYASADPTFIAAVIDFSTDKTGYSTNGGQTWTAFAASPTTHPTRLGGSIAASTASNIVFVESNRGGVKYTTNGGTSWGNATGVPAASAGPDNGWPFAYYINAKAVCADRVTANKFYAYNYVDGVYRSTDSGANWTLAHATLGGNIGHYRIRSVPGNAGHLFFTPGRAGNRGDAQNGESLWRSTDAGSNWSAVSGMTEVYDIGFGAVKSGASYPTIFVAGWYNGAWGIWRSIDSASSWTKIGDFPNGNFDIITAVAGDLNQWNACIVAFQGSGWARFA